MTKLNFQLNKKGCDYIELKFLFFTLLLVSSLLGCVNKKDNCIKELMEDGMTYEEAKEACDEAQEDSMIRS